MTQWCDWVKSRVLSLSLSRLERLWVPAVSYKGSTTVSCKYWLLHSHLSSQGTWNCIFCIQPFARTHTHVHTPMAGGATADTNQSIRANLELRINLRRSISWAAAAWFFSSKAECKTVQNLCDQVRHKQKSLLFPWVVRNDSNWTIFFGMLSKNETCSQGKKEKT